MHVSFSWSAEARYRWRFSYQWQGIQGCSQVWRLQTWEVQATRESRTLRPQLPNAERPDNLYHPPVLDPWSHRNEGAWLPSWLDAWSEARPIEKHYKLAGANWWASCWGCTGAPSPSTSIPKPWSPWNVNIRKISVRRGQTSMGGGRNACDAGINWASTATGRATPDQVRERVASSQPYDHSGDPANSRSGPDRPEHCRLKRGHADVPHGAGASPLPAHSGPDVVPGTAPGATDPRPIAPSGAIGHGHELPASAAPDANGARLGRNGGRGDGESKRVLGACVSVATGVKNLSDMVGYESPILAHWLVCPFKASFCGNSVVQNSTTCLWHPSSDHPVYLIWKNADCCFVINHSDVRDDHEFFLTSSQKKSIQAGGDFLNSSFSRHVQRDILSQRAAETLGLQETGSSAEGTPRPQETEDNSAGRTQGPQEKVNNAGETRELQEQAEETQGLHVGSKEKEVLRLSQVLAGTVSPLGLRSPCSDSSFHVAAMELRKPIKVCELFSPPRICAAATELPDSSHYDRAAQFWSSLWMAFWESSAQTRVFGK